MSRLAAGILSATDLLNHELFAFFRPNHFRLNTGALECGGAELQIALAVAYRQNIVESQLFSCGDFAKIDRQFLAFLHFVLSAAVGNDCVHGSLRILLGLLTTVSGISEPCKLSQIPARAEGATGKIRAKITCSGTEYS